MLDQRRRLRRRFIWTQKRLRTENRLLRQRIDYLEHESSALADRLIRGQVDLAQQADNCLSISHELNVLRDINSDAHRRLEDAYETIRELSSNDRGRRKTDSEGKSLVDTESQADDMSMIEHIHSLQQELIETHSRKADLENSVREMKLRIYELESANKRLKESPPDGGIASIQEELIRVKMREAESSLSLKDMRQRLAEVENHWMKYIQSRTSQAALIQSSQSMGNMSAESQPSRTSPIPAEPISGDTVTDNSIAHPSSLAPQTARGRIAKFTATLMGAAGSIGNAASLLEESAEAAALRELEDQFMSLKIREADAVAELKEMRQKVMELETQNHVCTNQLRRQDDELKRIKDEKESVMQAQKEVGDLLKEEQRKLAELQSERDATNMMQRLKYTEAEQSIADLKQHIAQLESKSAEKAAQAQIRGSSICDLDDDSIASNRSAGSLGDTNSLASEEMSAFLLEVTAKAPKDLLNSVGSIVAEDEDSEQERVETETETRKELHSQKIRVKSAPGNGDLKKPSAPIAVERSNPPTTNGKAAAVTVSPSPRLSSHLDDTNNDSGLNLSDN